MSVGQAVDAASAAAVPATVGTWALVNQATVPFLGVPLVVVSMAATGALISFGVGAPVKDRKQLIRLAAVLTLLGSALTGLLPVVFAWKWAASEAGRGVMPAFALIVSLSLRFILPVLVDLAPAATRGALKRFLGIEANSLENAK